MRRIPASLGLLLCTVVLTSCGGDDGPDLSSIDVTPNPITIPQQQTAQLNASVLNSAGELVTGIPVTFASTDTDIATVSNTGLVTAMHAGTATIQVKASGLRTNVPVTVSAVSSAIIVTPNPGVVPQNGTLQLTAVVNDVTGQPVPGAPLTFTSVSPSVATVSSTGLVDPVGPAGQVAIMIQSGGLSTTVTVAITPVATTLDVTPNPVQLGKSSSMQFGVTVRDLVGTAMPGIVPAFLSSNTGLATVSTTGLLQGKGSTGTLQVQVTASGLTAQVPVTLVDLTSPAGILDGTASVEGAAYGIDVSPSGVVIVSGTVTSRATLTNRVFTTLVPVSGVTFQYAPAIALSGTSAWISGLPDRNISEVNATTGAVLGTISGGAGANYFVLRFSADGTRLYAAGSGAFTVINPATRIVERNLVVQSEGLSLALNPVGTTVFVGGYGTIQEITPSTGAVRNVTSEAHTNFAIAPDGQRLYLVSEGEATIKVVQVSDGALLRTIPVPCSGWGIAISPDGRKLFDTCGSQIVIVDVSTDAVLQNLSVGGETRRTAFSADGATAVVTNAQSAVHFIR